LAAIIKVTEEIGRFATPQCPRVAQSGRSLGKLSAVDPLFRDGRTTALVAQPNRRGCARRPACWWCRVRCIQDSM